MKSHNLASRRRAAVARTPLTNVLGRDSLPVDVAEAFVISAAGNVAVTLHTPGSTNPAGTTETALARSIFMHTPTPTSPLVRQEAILR